MVARRKKYVLLLTEGFRVTLGILWIKSHANVDASMHKYILHDYSLNIRLALLVLHYYSSQLRF